MSIKYMGLRIVSFKLDLPDCQLFFTVFLLNDAVGLAMQMPCCMQIGFDKVQLRTIPTPFAGAIPSHPDPRTRHLMAFLFDVAAV